MKHFIELDMTVPENLHDEWLVIKEQHKLKDGQISVTNVVGHENDPYFGTGSLYHDWANKVMNEDGSYTVPPFANPKSESDFTTISDIKCFMVVGDEVKHLSADHWWYADTTVPHTVFNGSSEPRIHLVFSLVNGI